MASQLTGDKAKHHGRFGDLKLRLRSYWSLIKSLQTFLLLLTGLAGYASTRCPVMNLPIFLKIAGSLFLAISGSTVLNMWYDRDIDARMDRTCWRPLPSGRVKPKEALILGVVLSTTGVLWAFGIDLLYGLIVFAGLVFDVVIYTIWLKRRTAWSIVWGGLAGGMPILAGRVLGLGYIDWFGISMMFAVLFWIPTHILTFNMRYFEDYKKAGIPTFPSTYGYDVTRWTIALSSLMAALAIGLSAVGIGMAIGAMRLLVILSAGLLALALRSLLRPSNRLDFRLFKYASLYMLGSMLLLVSEAF
jgi:protoheme IX farnesyltransferase